MTGAVAEAGARTAPRPGGGSLTGCPVGNIILIGPGPAVIEGGRAPAGGMPRAIPAGEMPGCIETKADKERESANKERETTQKRSTFVEAVREGERRRRKDKRVSVSLPLQNNNKQSLPNIFILDW